MSESDYVLAAMTNMLFVCDKALREGEASEAKMDLLGARRDKHEKAIKRWESK